MILDETADGPQAYFTSDWEDWKLWPVTVHIIILALFITTRKGLCKRFTKQHLLILNFRNIQQYRELQPLKWENFHLHIKTNETFHTILVQYQI